MGLTYSTRGAQTEEIHMRAKDASYKIGALIINF